jgi:hypothetical protein
MNELIITVDDGVSALVWGRRVRAALEAGRTVTAITDRPDDGYCAIGTGDGLPGFRRHDLDFFSFPGFRFVEVGGLDDPNLPSVLDSVAPGSLVVWNMDIFTSPIKWGDGRGSVNPVPDTVWLALVERLTSGRFDNFFQFYGMWTFEDFDTTALTRLKAIKAAAVSGCANFRQRRLFEALHPEYVRLFHKSTTKARKAGNAWADFRDAAYRELEFDYRRLVNDSQAYPLMRTPEQLPRGINRALRMADWALLGRKRNR